MAVIVALVAVSAATGAVHSASAHSCSAPSDIGVREPATITLGVPAEETPVTAVEVTIPKGFDLDEATGAQGWKVTRNGSKLRFSGGPVPAFGCAYFSLAGQATRRAKLLFALRVTGSDGSSRDYNSDDPEDPDSGQLVYAGIDPTAPEVPTTSPLFARLGVALGVIAAGAFVWWMRSEPSAKRRSTARRSRRGSAGGSRRRRR